MKACLTAGARNHLVHKTHARNTLFANLMPMSTDVFGFVCTINAAEAKGPYVSAFFVQCRRRGVQCRRSAVSHLFAVAAYPCQRHVLQPVDADLVTHD